MTSYFWHPWEHQEQESNATDETENTLEIEERGKLVLSEEVQRLVHNCHSYFYESSGAQYIGKKTAQALKIPLRTIEKIVEQGKVMKNGSGKNQRIKPFF